MLRNVCSSNGISKRLTLSPLPAATLCNCTVSLVCLNSLGPFTCTLICWQPFIRFPFCKSLMPQYFNLYSLRVIFCHYKTNKMGFIFCSFPYIDCFYFWSILKHTFVHNRLDIYCNVFIGRSSNKYILRFCHQL
jgi:hypothetical protein